MKKITLLIFGLLFASYAHAQFPQGFEGATFPPTGWTSFSPDDDPGIENEWELYEVDPEDEYTLPYVHSGDQAAVIYFEYPEDEEDDVPGWVAQDWLVTPQVAITAANSILSFYQRSNYGGDYGDSLNIYVSTSSQTDISSFELVLGQTFRDLDPNGFHALSVDLSDYIGDSVYVAFVFTNNDGDNWYIDDVNFIDPATLPACAVPTSPANAIVDLDMDVENDYSVTLSWTAATTGGEADNYQIYFGTSEDEMILLGSTEELSVELTGIYYGMTYYWSIVSESDSQAIGCPVWSFKTVEQDPIEPDYLMEFDESLPSFEVNWVFGSGSLENGPVLSDDTAWDTSYYWVNDYEGEENMSVRNNLYGEDYNEDWLLSPVFDLSNGPHYLNFDIGLTEYGDTVGTTFEGDDFVALLVTVDGGDTWTEITRWDSTTPVSATGESVDEITLNQTGNTRFAFFVSSIGTESDYEFFLDNFQITTESLGTADRSLAGLKYYPNPVRNEFTVSGPQEIKELSVYNLVGQKIREQKFDALDATINLSDLATGQYFVKVNTADSVKTIKILKN